MFCSTVTVTVAVISYSDWSIHVVSTVLGKSVDYHTSQVDTESLSQEQY